MIEHGILFSFTDGDVRVFCLVSADGEVRFWDDFETLFYGEFPPRFVLDVQASSEPFSSTELAVD